MCRRGDRNVPGLRALLATMLRTPGGKKCALFLDIVVATHFLSALGAIISNQGAKVDKKTKKTHKKIANEPWAKSCAEAAFCKGVPAPRASLRKKLLPALFKKLFFCFEAAFLGKPFANIWCATIGWSFSNVQRIGAQSAHAVKIIFNYFWRDLVFFLSTFWFWISETQFHFRLAVKNIFLLGHMFCWVSQIQYKNTFFTPRGSEHAIPEGAAGPQMLSKMKQNRTVFGRQNNQKMWGKISKI